MRADNVASAAVPSGSRQVDPVSRWTWPRRVAPISARLTGGTTDSVCRTSAPGNHRIASAARPASSAVVVTSRNRPERGRVRSMPRLMRSSASIMVSSEISSVSVASASGE